ncbi:MAG: hypothetical protein E6J29_06305 [Chloroflexi bacterium]|nr:MAG: hypothetical protein E6J29_06305 [Chloroflexota bacterium]
MIDLQLGRWVELAGIEPKARWTARLAAFTILAVGLSGVLVWRLADLQLIQGATFAREALVNRVHRVPLEAERGVIYDRHGVQLVVNQPAWSLAVTTIALPSDRHQRAAELARLAPLAGMTQPELAARLAQDEPLRAGRPPGRGRQRAAARASRHHPPARRHPPVRRSPALRAPARLRGADRRPGVQAAQAQGLPARRGGGQERPGGGPGNDSARP